MCGFCVSVPVSTMTSVRLSGALGRRLHADVAARPGLVVDDDGAVEGGAELLGRPARAQVARAAGRTGGDDAHCAGGIILGRGIAPGGG
jgi:hypothetical protein